jgi:hypothetical protein
VLTYTQQRGIKQIIDQQEKMNPDNKSYDQLVLSKDSSRESMGKPEETDATQQSMQLSRQSSATRQP